jgi:hypothetical protein
MDFICAKIIMMYMSKSQTALNIMGFITGQLFTCIFHSLIMQYEWFIQKLSLLITKVTGHVV